MARAKGLLLLVAVAAVLAVAACDPGAPKQEPVQAPKQDMAFVEGCWVLHWGPDESVSMKTHIVLDEDAQAYRGIVHEYGEPNYEFIFARDGSWLEMDNHSPLSVRRLTTAPRPRLIAVAPPPEIAAQFPDRDRIALFRYEEGDWVIVSRTGDHIGVSQIHADGKTGQTYFGGQRETCE